MAREIINNKETGLSVRTKINNMTEELYDDKADQSDLDTTNEAVALNTLKVGVTNQISSDVTGITGASQVTNIVAISQANYDALTPDTNTQYLITDA